MKKKNLSVRKLLFKKNIKNFDKTAAAETPPSITFPTPLP